ncbi:GNAT family N-acetyltransferase [Thermoactinomyces sp. CICC 10521]|nr:GNAT family N-acetyltransferase [Thermoactinomyces sp. CICC 10523]MBH8602981.1 GNAT family N-acetyltransferase [Thermoactinomyces sp. CICC 10522]MBH8607171.1 GNAT family N-acetyltransferase [Thermoactinomyces sp. CICC 10521]
MIKRIHLGSEEQVRQILQVQQAAYRVEAKMIGCEELPPLKDTKDSIKQSGETFLGFFAGEELAGFLAFKRTGDFIRICRLAVSPSHFRRGVASALLKKVLQEDGVKEWGVTTGKANLPAIRCYEKHGFVRVAERLTPEGIVLIYLRKQLTKSEKKG